MEELKKHILDEIEKTGYLTELRVSKIFIDNSWNCRENQYYIDQDENKGREIDLKAHINAVYDDQGSKADDGRIAIWSMLSVEIKKSDKPWVIFTSSRRRFTEAGGYGLLNHTHNINHKLLSYVDIMKEHPSTKKKRMGRKEFVAFTKGQPQIFSAILSATKSCIESHRQANGHKEAYNDHSHDAVFYTPLVVLDGCMFEAYLNDNDEIEIAESDFLTYSFNYASPSYDSNSYLVDVVTVKGLDAYLSAQRKWIEGMVEAVKQNIENGTE